ncbi:hypothetical protein ONZ43_g5782 [Nemania bipapillata]|uniref:Uncharacterized protein n=1 Tax=Nemania bipapillata TaxID=110536 RepID=A0ACC2I6L8_9PEZI|nr:hypothetical protein ONZ43_g5782 [Nemania bipapillata]
MEPSQDNAPSQEPNNNHDDKVDSPVEQVLAGTHVGDEAICIEDLPERLATMEKKLKLVDDIFGFHKPAEEKEEEESDSSSDELDIRNDHEFLSHTLQFMRETLASHNRIQSQRTRLKKRVIKSSVSNLVRPDESESARQISIEAILKGKPATTIQVQWDLFINDKEVPEKYYMTPIQIAIGEFSKPYFNLKKPPQRDEFGKLRIEDLEETPLPERIRIRSAALNFLLDRCFRRPEVEYINSLCAADTVVFLRPFRVFIYYEYLLRAELDKLEKRFKDRDSERNNEKTTEDGDERATNIGEEREKIGDYATTLLHLRCLMNFIDDEIKPKVKHIESDQCRKIHFFDLCYLFKPGGEVVDQSEKQAYRIIRVEIPRHRVQDPWLRWTLPEDDTEKEARESVWVFCAYIDFDGKHLGPVSTKFRIPSFEGAKDIKSLPIYPLRFSKHENLRKNLVRRGEMLLSLTTFKPMYYKGFSLDTRDEIDSQVIVDFSEALSDKSRRHWVPTIGPLHNPEYDRRPRQYCSADCCRQEALIYIDNTDQELTRDFIRKLVSSASSKVPSLIFSPRLLEEALPGTENAATSDELVVMTYRVFGFVLRSRKWAHLDLTFLRYEDVDARNSTLSAFDRLELPDGHRQMVRSLVTQHFRNRQAMFTKSDENDLVRGKGKGLIILLHGAPGVGDLGTTARDVEYELEKNFSLASRWGCILLLDEADVFLSARERKDFERNGLVSVFLRVLEYYSGILFLTTNRIGDFDEAFASRIHMSLHYPELNEEKTKRVFKLNLDLIQERFDRQGRTIIYDASSIEDFAEHHFHDHRYSRWNGRQIRNACQTALALAEFDAHGGNIEGPEDPGVVVKLELKYFRLVQTAYLDFGHYLGDIRGTQGDRRAIDHGFRAKISTPYQTTPNRFSMPPTQDRAYSGSISSEYNNNYAYRYPSQGDEGNNLFQPLANQSGVGGGYGRGGSSNMGYQTQGQYGPQQGQMGPGGEYSRYDNSQAHNSYTQPGNQQGQLDPRAYQQPNQAGQNWGNVSPSMNQGYRPAGQPQLAQGYGSNSQGQNVQGQHPQGQTIYGHSNMQQGGGIQNLPLSGADFTGQNQFPQGGSGGLEGGSPGRLA